MDIHLGQIRTKLMEIQLVAEEIQDYGPASVDDYYYAVDNILTLVNEPLDEDT